MVCQSLRIFYWIKK